MARDAEDTELSIDEQFARVINSIRELHENSNYQQRLLLIAGLREVLDSFEPADPEKL